MLEQQAHFTINDRPTLVKLELQALYIIMTGPLY